MVQRNASHIVSIDTRVIVQVVELTAIVLAKRQRVRARHGGGVSVIRESGACMITGRSSKGYVMTLQKLTIIFRDIRGIRRRLIMNTIMRVSICLKKGLIVAQQVAIGYEVWQG